jgi:hypothetical protein
MPAFYKNVIPIIETDKPPTSLSHPSGVRFGMVPRDYSVDPQEMFDQPDGMQLIPQSEWDARFDEQEETESSLEHIFLSGPSGGPAFTNLDQNGHGYCWAYSVGHAIMIDRLRRNLPMVRLNPHATAAIIKGGRDEGGWCGLSAKWGREHGYAEEGTKPGQWPLHSRDIKYDTNLLRLEMAKRKIDEEWTDLTKQVYDQNLTMNQVATCGFNNIPGPRDYNWWGHSVCALRWVRVERGAWGQLILNSWKGWGRHGLGVLLGSQAVCNGGLAVRLTSA